MDKQDSAARLCTIKESIMLGGGYGGTTMELRDLDSEQVKVIQRTALQITQNH
jgi:hypothetical protein